MGSGSDGCATGRAGRRARGVNAGQPGPNTSHAADGSARASTTPLGAGQASRCRRWRRRASRASRLAREHQRAPVVEERGVGHAELGRADPVGGEVQLVRADDDIADLLGREAVLVDSGRRSASRSTAVPEADDADRGPVAAVDRLPVEVERVPAPGIAMTLEIGGAEARRPPPPACAVAMTTAILSSSGLAPVTSWAPSGRADAPPVGEARCRSVPAGMTARRPRRGRSVAGERGRRLVRRAGRGRTPQRGRGC